LQPWNQQSLSSDDGRVAFPVFNHGEQKSASFDLDLSAGGVHHLGRALREILEGFLIKESLITDKDVGCAAVNEGGRPY
jgi:hypothetical protein